MPARIPPDSELPDAPAMIIGQSPTHVIIAVEISRAALARNERFLRMLLAAAAEPPPAGG